MLIFSNGYEEDGPDGGATTALILEVNWRAEDHVPINLVAPTGSEAPYLGAGYASFEGISQNLIDYSLLPNYLGASEGFDEGFQIIPLSDVDVTIL